MIISEKRYKVKYMGEGPPGSSTKTEWVYYLSIRIIVDGKDVSWEVRGDEEHTYSIESQQPEEDAVLIAESIDSWYYMNSMGGYPFDHIFFRFLRILSTPVGDDWTLVLRVRLRGSSVPLFSVSENAIGFNHAILSVEEMVLDEQTKAQ